MPTLSRPQVFHEQMWLQKHPAYWPTYQAILAEELATSGGRHVADVAEDARRRTKLVIAQWPHDPVYQAEVENFEAHNAWVEARNVKNRLRPRRLDERLDRFRRRIGSTIGTDRRETGAGAPRLAVAARCDRHEHAKRGFERNVRGGALPGEHGEQQKAERAGLNAVPEPFAGDGFGPRAFDRRLVPGRKRGEIGVRGGRRGGRHGGCPPRYHDRRGVRIEKR